MSYSSDHLAFILALLCASALVIPMLTDPRRFIQYPFLAALLFILYILPAAYPNLDNPALPRGAATHALLYMTASLSCLAAGWWLAQQSPARVKGNVRPNAATWFTVALAIIGVGSLYLMQGRPITEVSERQPTGAVAILFFFTEFGLFALTMAGIMATRLNSRLGWWVLITLSAILLPIFLFLVKREYLAFFALLAIGLLTLNRGWRPPRVLVAAIMVGAFFVINSASVLRTLVQNRADDGTILGVNLGIEQISQAPLLTGLSADYGIYSDFGNAVRVIDRISSESAYNYGLVFWDRMVFSFFPGYIFGSETKKSLYLLGYASDDAIWGSLPRAVGSTYTAFGDSYGAFGFFGVLIFAAVGWAYGRVFVRAKSGSVPYQFVYFCLLPGYLTAISHESARFLVNGVLIGVLCGVFVALATTNHSRHSLVLTPTPRRVAEAGWISRPPLNSGLS